MKTITTLSVAIGAGLCLGLLAQADEIQFTTLPQPVQTTVIRETHITSPSSVTRVIKQEGGAYMPSQCMATAVTRWSTSMTPGVSFSSREQQLLKNQLPRRRL